METIKILKKGILISAAATLIACGGGGGGSGGGIAYSGKTTEAKVTSDNASELFSATEGGAEGASGGSKSTSAESKGSRKRSVGFGRSLTRATRSASADYRSRAASGIAALQVEDETVPGDCGGEAVITGTWDDAFFDIDLSITFNDYCVDGATPEEGSTFNGSVGIKGKEDKAAGTFKWTISFTDLNFKDKTDNLTLNGSIASEGTDTDYTVVMNYVFQDHVASKVYKAENLTVSIKEDLFGDYVTAAISGTVYHPDHGSFKITTVQKLVIYYVDDYPTAGIVRIDGADGTYAIAEYHSTGKYTLTINDGTGEIKKTCDSVTGVCT